MFDLYTRPRYRKQIRRMLKKVINPFSRKNAFDHVNSFGNAGPMTIAGFFNKCLLMFFVYIGVTGLVISKGWLIFGGSGDITVQIFVLFSIVIVTISVFYALLTNQELSNILGTLFVAGLGLISGIVINSGPSNAGMGNIIGGVIMVVAITLLILTAFYHIRIRPSMQTKVGFAGTAIGVYILLIILVRLNILEVNTKVHLTRLSRRNPLPPVPYYLLLLSWASYLLLSVFNIVEIGTKTKKPQFMEWYSAFGIFFSISLIYMFSLSLLRLYI